MVNFLTAAEVAPTGDLLSPLIMLVAMFVGASSAEQDAGMSVQQILGELLENVAGRIVKEIEKRFPQFVSFSVRVSKKRPPVDGIAQWSRVTLYHE